jgi:HPt (histidine-containing phosphotransfer) domain-containing protein
VTDFEARMAELRTRFLARAEADRALLAIALRQEDWDEVRRIAHGLSGTAGVFGFASLARRRKAWKQRSMMAEIKSDLRRLCGALLDALRRFSRLKALAGHLAPACCLRRNCQKPAHAPDVAELPISEILGNRDEREDRKIAGPREAAQLDFLEDQGRNADEDARR